MYRLIFLSLVMLLFSFLSRTLAQQATKTTDYPALWKTVADADKKGLPQTALKTTNEIYSKAKLEKNTAQLVKAVIHILKYTDYEVIPSLKYTDNKENDGLIKNLNRLDQETKTAVFPVKPILHSMLAEAYWHYYQQNIYEFGKRTQTVNFKNDDISTWSLEKLVSEVIKNFRLSLSDGSPLQKVKIDVYDAIITDGNTKGRSFRPTLYDFIAHRAANFFMNDEASITKPAYSFTINSPDYLSDAIRFSKIKITSKDSLSFKFYALQIFQDLIRFHLNDQNTDALVQLDLERLQFVQQNLTLGNKQDLYLDALSQLEKKYSTQPVSSLILYNIAQIWNQKGRFYSPLQSDEHKEDLKKAFNIYQTAITRFPESDGGILSYNAQHQLLYKFINATAEKINVPGLPFRALVQYKNIHDLYWRAISVNREEIQAERKKWSLNYNLDREEKFLQHFILQSATKSGTITLPTDDDLQNHAAEVKIDALPIGDYMLLFSANPDFSVLNNHLTYTFTTISNLSYISRNMDDGSTELYTLDRTSGEPINGANAQVYYKIYNAKSENYDLLKSGIYASDENGLIKIPYQKKGDENYNSFYATITKQNDQICTQDMDEYQYSSGGQIYQELKNKPVQTTLTQFFLDRAIYRPGQTIYYKGLTYTTDGKTPNILPNKAFTITFYDVNSQVVASTDVVTNEYGTFNGTFIAPVTGLTGQMFLQMNDEQNSITYFSVEEYKRPKFEVNFDPIKGTFRLGDSIKTTGKAMAFSGANIDGASVKYRVVRKARFPFWWWCTYGYYPNSPTMEITNGTTQTDADGKFTIPFAALPDEKVDPKTNPTFTYTIDADVTDINGETHSSQSNVTVAYKSLIIGVKTHDIDLSATDSLHRKFTITSTNLAGEFEPAKGNITIWKLKSPAIAYRNRLWQQPDKQSLSRDEFAKYFPNDLYANENNFYKWNKEKEVFNLLFDSSTGKEINFKDLTAWEPGKYQLEITSSDKFGQEVKEVSYFEVNNSQTKNLAFPEIQKFDLQNPACEPGEKASIVVGSSENIYGLFETEYDGKIVDKRIIKLNNATQKLDIPIIEEYRGNLSLHFTFVKNNRAYSKTNTVIVPYTNKLLNIRFETFRNKLQPGQQEQWKLKISGKNTDKVLAEMVATMYDASLDAFALNNWSANFYNSLYARLPWNCGGGFEKTNFKNWEKQWNNFKNKVYKRPNYDNLNWFGLDFNSTGSSYMSEILMSSLNQGGIDDESAGNNNIKPMAMSMGKSMRKSAMFVAPIIKEDKEVYKQKAILSDAAQGKNDLTTDQNSTTPKRDFTDVKVRKNFNETAFFYPNLKTNENGEIIIDFTVPEALTRWKMLGFAHTKELQSGLITNQLVTQKELMVVPNQPRFLRENDKMKFSVKITSLTDSALTGNAQLEFFDALTMKPINGLMNNRDFQKSFQIKAKQSTNLEWDIEIPEGIQAINYRIVAKADNFADGEEMTLPVVTNRMLITETLPLPIHGNQTKTFTLDKLLNNTSSTLKNQRYTLEFTSNPAWYAIQALPYLMEYPYDCTEQTFSRFYANSIATHIANANPKIKRIFDIWSTIQPDALLSNLEKNQELKTALLEETPWVLNAKDESQRKRSVALLFDLNRMASEQEHAIKKIKEAQSGNGGFTWFPGFPEDRFITQFIVTGFGHLDAMGVKTIRTDAVSWEMVQKAIGYIDKQMNDSYQVLKAEAKKGNLKLDDNHLDVTEIQYLYARSYFKDVPLNNKHKEAFSYFLSQASNYWLQNNIYMQGMIALALFRNGDKIIPPSIIKSLHERAIHSDEMGMYWKNKSGYFWYQAPIETQALLIEVFDEVANDKQAVEELKVWLLKQKQTQDWRTTKATAEACYALLRHGSDLLTTDNQVEIKVGNENIDPSQRPDIKTEAGTGYFKTAWTASEITKEMGNIQVTKKDVGIAWGAIYWQYFEQLDKITSAETPLKLKKQLFVQKNTDRGPVISPITDTTSLKVGDLVKVRIELRVDREMEYIHLKDMRAAGFEPIETLSTYKYQEGLYYYESPRDLATNFFISHLPKGTYVFEYPLRVSQKGNFSNGVTTIQCMYAPEFSSHSEGVRVTIK